MRDKVDCAPTAVVSMRNRPPPLIDPPVTLSPVLRDGQALAGQQAFIDLAVSARHNAVNRQPLARANHDHSLIATAATGTSTSPLPRSTRARSGRNDISALSPQ